jgi:hypothetical protein
VRENIRDGKLTGGVTLHMENISYQELWEIFKDSGIVTDFEKKRLEWIRHLARMDHGMLVKKIVESTPEGRRRRMGRPRLRWLEDVENYLQEMKVKRWRGRQWIGKNVCL